MFIVTRISRKIFLVGLMLFVSLTGCNFPLQKSSKQPPSVAIVPVKPSPPPTVQSEPDQTPSAVKVSVDSTPSPILAAKAQQETRIPVVDDDFLKYVPPGPFMMGSTPEDGGAKDDEFPGHSVYISGFWIYKKEVTNAMYAACVAAGKCSPPKTGTIGPLSHYGKNGFNDWPVVGVSWLQAAAFCGFMDGRLPTEAEWEKTARGTDGKPYPWGENQPNCDLLNMKDCLKDPDTVKAGTFPSGASPYLVVDMAGNVREWVHDAYLKDYYIKSPLINPWGPTDPKLRVIRGGGFQDLPEDVRSAARFSAEKEKTFEDVGFRCVPVGTAQPPFCASTHIPFCTPPDQPGCEEGKAPHGSVTVNTNDMKVTNFSCPAGDSQTIYISTGVLEADQIAVQIGGLEYDCKDNPGFPGRLICTGRPLPMNTLAEIKICKKGTETPISFQSLSRLVPVNFPQQLPLNSGAPVLTFNQSTGDVASTYCGDDATYNPKTGLCERDRTKTNCPVGWTLIADSKTCQPTESGCPEGTRFSKNQCLPTRETCPAGYVLNEQKTCEPSSPTGGICPAGYIFNRKTNCCTPNTGDNNGCPEQTYWNQRYNKCLPIDQNGCGYGGYYVPGKGCLPDFNLDGSEKVTGVFKGPPDARVEEPVSPNGTQEIITPESNGDCPPGTLMKGGKLCGLDIIPNPTGCRIGYLATDRGCQPDTGATPSTCGSNNFLNPYDRQCYPPDENGCGVGYFFNAKMSKCQPTDGPGSGCPNGYAYNRISNCCVPVPGNQGSLCAGERHPPAGTLSALLNEFPDTTSFSRDVPGGNYIAAAGVCVPPIQGFCFPGYSADESGRCLPMSFKISDCPERTEGDNKIIQCRVREGNKCPNGTVEDTSNHTCTAAPSFDDVRPTCAPNQYFDVSNGFCLDRTEDCCRIGYRYDALQKACSPIPDNPDTGGNQCPLRLTWDGKTCSTGKPEEPTCWVIKGSVPVCNGPCYAPQVWDARGKKCVAPGTLPGVVEPSVEPPVIITPKPTFNRKY